MEILERQSVDGGQRTASFPSKQPVLVSRSSSPATFCHRWANDTAPFQRKSGATLTTCALYRGGSGSEVGRATNTHAKYLLDVGRGDARVLLERSRTARQDRPSRAKSRHVSIYILEPWTRVSAHNRHPFAWIRDAHAERQLMIADLLILYKFS